MSEMISLNHGSGGKQSLELIKKLFARKFNMEEPLTDSAVLKDGSSLIAFTTDSYVVDPIFFPGGDIGKLAVCGTVNDISVSGAIPRYISASFILEEGFPFSDLVRIVESMAREAEIAQVKIVTGDTKVVGKGKCDGIFITTAGIGFLKADHADIGSGKRVTPEDRLIVNGPLGNHAIAVLGARNDLNFSSSIISDCASLNHMIQNVLAQTRQIHFMRDITRGGLAAVLCELAQLSDSAIEVEEDSLPVEEPVKGLCEVLGFDPCFLANEGKVLIVAGEDEYETIISVLRSHPLGKEASVIGKVTGSHKGTVILNTKNGGRRILDVPSGIQLPRIC
jgi:hydrogenase expression/formation protein HypE